MGRFGLSSNEDSDDEVLMYPQDHGGEERTSITGRDQTLSNRALSTLIHPVPGVVVEDTFSSSSSSIREAMRRNEYYDFTIRGNHHACDQHGPLYEYEQVRPGNEEALSSRRRRSKTYFYYWKQFVFVMLLIVMQRYLPPPPPPVDSWGGYISHSTQGIKATITNLVALTMYIVTGCIHNLNEDLGMVMRSFLFRQGEPKIPISQDCIPCPLKVPIDNRDDPNQSLESIRNILQSNFVGKSAAIDILSNALVKWDSSSLANKRPLNMIFVGSDGVGKYEVAKQVGELLIHRDCQSDCNNPCSSCVLFHPSRILHLQGINHALNEESCAESLIRQILNHVYEQKNEGAVVILRHVEDLGDAAKRELIRLLSKPSVTFSVQDNDDDDGGETIVSGASVANSNLLERFLFGKEDKSQMIPTKKEVVVRLDNCVFLFTTDLGSDEIFRGLSNSAFESSALLLDQVARDIQEKLQGFFGVNFEMFDAIVPFWPLQYVEIKDIIKYKVNERSSRYKIELLDSALDYLAGPSNVDYMELKMIGAGDFDSFIFATRGGHDLVYEPIMQYIEEKLEVDVFHHDEEVTRVGYLGDGIWTMEQCEREGLLCIDKGHFQLEAEQFI